MCDRVHCDMAMLILPHVLQRTLEKRPEPFWPRRIERVRQAPPSFLFMAEVYWDFEWELQQQGFNYTYDIRLYDRGRTTREARPQSFPRGDGLPKKIGALPVLRNAAPLCSPQ